MNQVTVDILTPSYNYGRFIGEALESVARQLLPSDRHIVIDGASDDDTTKVLSSHHSPNLTWVSEPDMGQSDALNKGLALVDADVVGWLNADEYYAPGALDTVREMFDAYPATDVLYGDCLFVDEFGHPIRLLPAHRFSASVLRHYGCFIPSCATFIRADILRGSGWDPSFRRAMDWQLWLGLEQRGAQFTYAPRLLGVFRVHPAQVTATPEAMEAEEFSRLDALRGRSPRRLNRGLQDCWGRSLHVSLKLIDGGYWRQYRYRGARSMTGAPSCV